MIWDKIYGKAQEIVLRGNPGDYYKDAYMKDEMYYSYYCLQMMYQDSLHSKPENILDIGCGFGTNSVYSKLIFKDIKTYILDIENKIPFKTLNYLGLRFDWADIEFSEIRWPFQFERIIFTEALEHLRFNPKFVLDKIYNSLSDDGFMYLSTPDACSKWGRITNYYNHIGEMGEPTTKDIERFTTEHIYQYSEGELLRLLEESGFEVVEFGRSTPKWGDHLNLKVKKK
jgi:2-polyprenyl-3-methyl-5-hydroxy-6-metoxy-1,4-benzoquinol methylase